MHQGEVIPFPAPEVKKAEVRYMADEAIPQEPDRVGKYYVKLEDGGYRVSYFTSPDQVLYTNRTVTKEELSDLVQDLRDGGYQPGAIF